MSLRRTLVLLAFCAAPASSSAAVQQAPQQVPATQAVELSLRASAEAAPGSAVIDRGARDGVALGDRVIFRMRGGERVVGMISEVSDRSAVVDLREKDVLVPPGTPGRVSVTVPVQGDVPGPVQAESAEDAGAAEEPGSGAPEHPPWQRTDDEYSADMPLLAEVRAVIPKDRERSLTGRTYLSADTTHYTYGGSSQAFVRLGTDLRINNPFWLGGGLRFDAEIPYRASNMSEGPGEAIDTTGFRLDRFSYSLGGTRFREDRREFGRFLQHAVPEFGILDGFEYEKRFGNHRVSGSLGFLPELDFDMEMGKDVQLAAAYHWVKDTTERVGATAAYQKTWHNSSQDRDLLLLKAYALPEDGWDLSSTLWIDLYLGDELQTEKSIDVTQALARAARRSDSGGEVEFRYQRFKFADTLRLPTIRPGLGEVANGRFDRLSFAHSAPLTEETGFFGEIGGWTDEDGDGGDIELGLEMSDLRTESDRGDVSLFGVVGSFETVLGLRLGYTWLAERGTWRVGYEGSNRDQVGFLDDNDDVLQHGLSVERELRTDWGWDVSARGDVWFWDNDGAVSLGVYAQRNF